MSDGNPEQLNRFFRLSLDLVAIAGTDGHFRELNPMWEQTLGWSPDELRAEPFASLVHPDDVESTLTELELLANGHPAVSFVNRCRCADGTHRRLQWSATADGDAIVIVARDVTDLGEANTHALRSEHLLAAVLQTAADPIVVIDETGTMVQVNAATTSLFGYPADEMVGNNVKMLMPDPYHSEHDGYLQRYAATREPHIIGSGREVEARRADGQSFPIQLAVSEANTPDGRFFTGIIHDLTDVRRAQRQLEKVNAELEQRVTARTAQLDESNRELARSNRDLEQFAYIASHDLQAPLRNVRQGLELLNDHLTVELNTPFDGEAKELRDLIDGAVSRMELMIRGLLSYSRVHRREDIRTRPVDLGALAGEVIANLRLDIDQADVEVVVEQLPVVSGDPTLLAQLLQNLVQNAIKYRSKEGKSEIRLRAEPDGDLWHISVDDNGIGINPALHERIFELFRRGHSGYDGVGLGLAIGQRIVERHGGEIWLTSEPGIGSTFTFSLPGPTDDRSDEPTPTMDES